MCLAFPCWFLVGFSVVADAVVSVAVAVFAGGHGFPLARSPHCTVRGVLQVEM